MRADAQIAGEVDWFTGAVGTQFGAEGLRRLDRAGTVVGARVVPAEQGALAEFGRTVQAVRKGARVTANQARRLTITQRAGQGARMTP